MQYNFNLGSPLFCICGFKYFASDDSQVLKLISSSSRGSGTLLIYDLACKYINKQMTKIRKPS